MNAHNRPDNDKHLEILKNAVENTNEAFVTIDQESRVVFFNKAAERMFGYCRKEVLGRELGDILNPMCRDGHREAVARYLDTGKGRLIGHETEMTIVRKNGATLPVSISFSVSRINGQLFFYRDHPRSFGNPGDPGTSDPGRALGCPGTDRGRDKP